jgi:hypothetical protein
VLRSKLAYRVSSTNVPVERLYAERLAWLDRESESEAAIVHTRNILSQTHGERGVEFEVVVYGKGDLNIVPRLVIFFILELRANVDDKHCRNKNHDCCRPLHIPRTKNLKTKIGCEAQFTTSGATRVVSFFVLPTRLADGLEAKKSSSVIQIRPCVLLIAKRWFPRVVFLQLRQFEFA